MTHEYKEQPENQGKLVWLSGAPGLGKSTSGMLLGRKAGYVYYEADAFMQHLNPYVSTDVEEPTLAMMTQNFLKGVPQEGLMSLHTAAKILETLPKEKSIILKMCVVFIQPCV